MKWYLLLGTLVSIVLGCQNSSPESANGIVSTKQDDNGPGQSMQSASIMNVQNPIDSLSNLDSLMSLFTLSEDFLNGLNNNNEMSFTETDPFIKEGDARDRIVVYKAHETILRARLGERYDPKTDVYGFTFKLEHLEEFLLKIKVHNIDHAGDPKKVITGVRAYKSWRLIEGKLTPEIFLMPTIASRANLYTVDNDLSVGEDDLEKSLNGLFEVNADPNDSNDLILDTSIPCPNNCN